MKKDIKYTSKYVTAFTQDIEGKECSLVEIGDDVVVFPIIEDKVLLIKERRPIENVTRWKPVMGWVDKEGKTLLEHAQEELAEEANMVASMWQEFHTTEYKDTVQYKQHFFVCFDAIELKYNNGNPDNNDGYRIEETAWFSQEDLFAMLERDELLWDGEMLTCIMALRKYGK